MTGPAIKKLQKQEAIQMEGEHHERVRAIQKLPDDQMFFWQSYGYVGNCINFWRVGRAGYTTKLVDAGMYNKTDTLEQLALRRDGDVFWRSEDIRDAAMLTVDQQDLREAKNY